MSLNQNIIHSKNDSRKLNQFKTICNKFDQQEKKISKSTQKNRKLRKENNLLNKMIKQFDDNLGIEKTKKECTGTIWQARIAGDYWYTLGKW